jgi:hypothetical protein
LAGEALSYLIRKHYKRGLVEITLRCAAAAPSNERVMETLAAAIFQSVIGM